jgi:ribosome biogenesis GTPase A
MVLRIKRSGKNEIILVGNKRDQKEKSTKKEWKRLLERRNQIFWNNFEDESQM